MEPEAFYHIYNRGNNSQQIFFSHDNYIYFLKKIRNHIMSHVDIIAYCLMPNHFHLLVYSKPTVVAGDYSNGLRVLLNSYSRAINKQENRTGSLFQQNTKTKPCDIENFGLGYNFITTRYDLYPFICFHYIHQNPMKARIVERMEDWEMSSFQDYAGMRNGDLCNREIAYRLLEIPESSREFMDQSYAVNDGIGFDKYHR
jgi:putative transposase